MSRILYVMTASLSLSLFVHSAAAADLPAAADEVVSLVKKIITASGGETAVAGMTSVHASGDIEAYMRGDRGRYELFFQRPGKLRVETQYQQSSETRIVNNGRGYRGTDNAQLTPVQDHRFLAMVYQYRHFDLAYGLLTGMYLVRMKEKDHLNGKPVEVMHLTSDDGPPMDVYVDTEPFLIVKITGYFTVSDGRPTTLSSEFSDFRRVGDGDNCMKTDFLRETSAFLSCDPFARRHAEIFSDTPEQHALTPCAGKRQNPFWAADAGETIWYFLICTFLQSCYN